MRLDADLLIFLDCGSQGEHRERDPSSLRQVSRIGVTHQALYYRDGKGPCEALSFATFRMESGAQRLALGYPGHMFISGFHHGAVFLSFHPSLFVILCALCPILQLVSRALPHSSPFDSLLGAYSRENGGRWNITMGLSLIRPLLQNFWEP